MLRRVVFSRVVRVLHANASACRCGFRPRAFAAAGPSSGVLLCERGLGLWSPLPLAQTSHGDKDTHTSGLQSNKS